MRERIVNDIIALAKQLHAKNLLAAADGNISYRLHHDEIIITPAGKPKALLQPEDMAVITLNNEIIQGNPSSERLMHLAIYKQCPKARCVIHAHPPKAIAWTIARPDLKALPADCFSELILAAGHIPIAPYARPGTQTMGDVLLPYLPSCRIIVLARHGAISYGEDCQEALNGMERLEHSAEILFYAQALGGLTSLPAEEVSILHEKRKIIGERIL